MNRRERLLLLSLLVLLPLQGCVPTSFVNDYSGTLRVDPGITCEIRLSITEPDPAKGGLQVTLKADAKAGDTCSLFEITSTEVTREGDQLWVSGSPEGSQDDMDGPSVYRMQIKGLNPSGGSYGTLVGHLSHCVQAPAADGSTPATRCHRYVDFFVERVP